MKKQKIKLKPMCIMEIDSIAQSNTTRDGKYEILSIFHGSKVQSNTPLEFVIVEDEK